MTVTGWIAADQPEPAGSFTNFVLANRADPGEGRTVEQVLAGTGQRSWYDRRDEQPAADPDERAASLVARGYNPGMVSQLSQRLGETLGELQHEREKIARGARRAEQVHRMHQNGQLSALDVQRELDGDLGDQGAADRLERRAASLQRQIADATAMISPGREHLDGDGVAAASRRARAVHAEFVQRTQAAMAAAQAPGRAGPRRPFRRPWRSK